MKILLTIGILILLPLIFGLIVRAFVSSSAPLSNSAIKKRFVIAFVLAAAVAVPVLAVACYIVGLSLIYSLPLAAAVVIIAGGLSWSRRKYWNFGDYLSDHE